MGFPGSTERYLTASGIQQMMDCSNTPRIRIRTARQEVLKSEMDKSDKVRIQYASKYARSSNYWKNAIGMNKAIVDNKVLEGKKEQETRFAEFAKRVNNKEYQEVVSNIDRQYKPVIIWNISGLASSKLFLPESNMVLLYGYGAIKTGT